MLTDTEIQTLNDARTILTELEQTARKESYLRTDDESGRPDHWRSARLGALGERAEAAEYAIFQVFNCATSSRLLDLTEEQLHNRQADEVTA